DAETIITLCHEGEVVELDLHTYLCGVVAAEMPASFPEAALEAQAVAARTYSLYQLGLYDNGKAIPESHQGAQLCSDYTHCKAYTDLAAKSGDLWGANAAYYRDRITRAVERTDGRIATYEGEPIAAVFHSTSSERTESALAVWGNDTPYLVSVESPGGEASPRWQGEVVLSTAEVKEKLLGKWTDMMLDCEPQEWFKASERSEAGGIITVAVGGVRVKGTELRTLLGLNSTNFTMKVEGDQICFSTTGYGHGVGMSQYGAKALAEEGKTCDEIIKWYYTGVEVEQLGE
ncbi:MAG: stage II sporulation protein D, partial [Clostridia bacterium]|nr:stage II sporulation protein D [Clostridia bacterium]